MNKTIFSLFLGTALAVPAAVASIDITHFAGTPMYTMDSVANSQASINQPPTVMDLVSEDLNSPFGFDFQQYSNKLNLSFNIAPDHRLYVNNFTFKGNDVVVGEYKMPQGTPYTDEFFGDVSVYENQVKIEVPLYDFKPNATVDITYQGCKDGFCYPPESKTIDIQPFDVKSPANKPKSLATLDKVEQSLEKADPEGRFESPLMTLGLFFLLGLGLAFTPCVLPMYPILSSIVLGNGQITKRRALALSAAYTQGMAVTYTGLGLLVASAGMHFQAALQHPAILISISIMFVVLSLSMFGAYTLQLPSSLQTKLNEMTNKHEGGNLFGVFAMGAISGLVLSPCTTAPLSGALLYVAQSGDVFKGGLALYSLATGMGIPLVLLTTFGSGFLPKAGAWMNVVKVFFGFVLLSAPIFLLERILDSATVSLLWMFLGMLFFGWAYHIGNSCEGLKRTVLVVLSMSGISAVVSTAVVDNVAENYIPKETKPLPFGTVTSLPELKHKLSLAKQEKSPVMLDLYADWCSACKQFEKYTFSDSKVQQSLSDFTLIKVDVTENTPKNQEILKYLGAVGLPTIEFWSDEGEHCEKQRVSGFLEAKAFSEHVDQNVNQK